MQAGCTINYGRILGPELAPKKAAGIGAESGQVECDNSLPLCTYRAATAAARMGDGSGPAGWGSTAALWAASASASRKPRCPGSTLHERHYSCDLGNCLIPLTMELNCVGRSVPVSSGSSVSMSYLARLRVKAQGVKGTPLLYVFCALLLLGMAWWFVPSRVRSGANDAGRQSSLFRRVGQRGPISPPAPKLQISGVRQTGQVVEIQGTADCNAAVMINGESAPLIFDHCGFKHFLLLPDGPSTIAVTAQGPAGGVNTQLLKVNIE